MNNEIIFKKKIEIEKLKEIKPTTWKRMGFTYNSFREYSEIPKFNIELEGNINYQKINIEDIEDDERFGLDSYQRQLNKAYFNSGFRVKIKKVAQNQKENKMKINYFKNNKDIIDYNLIQVEENAQVDIIFDYQNEYLQKGIRNSYYKFKIARGAKVNIVFSQRLALDSESFSAVIMDIEASAIVKQYYVDLGANVHANSTRSYIGENSVSEIYSLYLVDQERKIDLEYSSIHQGQRSESIIEGRGILKDSAKKVFRGNLEFKYGSSKSKGKEEEFVLLLNKDVRAHSIPTLFCDEDDVVGEHAASAGSINENMLFYLTSRGISRKDAIKLIALSSFKPILKEINSKKLVSDIEAFIEERI